jgi:hypothetical protein
VPETQKAQPHEIYDHFMIAVICLPRENERFDAILSKENRQQWGFFLRSERLRGIFLLPHLPYHACFQAEVLSHRERGPDTSIESSLN